MWPSTPPGRSSALAPAKSEMACLEPRGDMPGFAWEVSVAEEEGVKLFPGRTFKEVVVKGNKVAGVRCVEVEFHGFKRGLPGHQGDCRNRALVAGRLW